MNRVSRIALLLIGSLGLAIGVGAQEPVLSRFEAFTAPGEGPAINIGPRVPTFYRLAWGPTASSLSACTVKLEKSEDGVVWTDLLPAQDCKIAGTAEAIVDNTNFIRIAVTALSGGTVLIEWRGYDGAGCSLEYEGIVSVVVGVDPAPGAEQVITVPSAERWKILSAHFELVASSTPGDRSVFFSLDENGNEYFRTFADGIVQANQRGIFTASTLGFVGTAGLGPSSIHQPVDMRTILIPIQQDTYVPGGHNIRTITDGLEPGDDYNAASLLVEKCPN